MEKRTKWITFFIAIIFAVVIARLFYLQVIHGSEYRTIAVAQRSSKIEIPARRGEILLQDTATGDLVKMATNTSLYNIAVDPFVTPDKRKVANRLAPLLFTENDFENCQEDLDYCPQTSLKYIEYEHEERDENGEIVVKIDQIPQAPATWNQAVEAMANEIYEKISQENVSFTVIKRELSDEQIAKIKDLRLEAIGVNEKQNLIYADPSQITEKERKKIARALKKIIEMDEDDIVPLLTSRKLRYVKLKKHIDPDSSEEIKKIKKASYEAHAQDKQRIFLAKLEEEPLPDYFRGIILEQEHLRYYPDKNLGAQIFGFVSSDNMGRYGIEGKFNNELLGKVGIIESQNDILGMQIGAGTENVQDAENGISVIVTIDRIIQKNVEEILARAVEKFRADSGQVVIMEPFTGNIIAMANYPTFNPNKYGNVYLMRRTTPEDAKNIFTTTPLFRKNEDDDLIVATFEEFEEAWKLGFDPEFYIYSNRSGPEAYMNKIVQETYEPGSVFKPLVMAAALDAGEVSPFTKFNEDGPIKVGQFEIKTATEEYNGWQTMTNVLETSSNIGMSFVAEKLGRAVFYKYLKKFGFGEYTDIELENEAEGKVMYYKKWSDALLLTSSFGQGLTVTPIQMVTAWSALANGGLLMKPHIISEIRQNGKILQKIEPEEVSRVISPETSITITAMLVSAVDNGVAHGAKVPGHKIAGKTGTSQIANIHGVGYEDTSKEGSVITSFAGYAPIDNPKFVMLVKFNRARVGDNAWGSTTAAPVFKEIATYLFNYYGIPPDEE